MAKTIRNKKKVRKNKTLKKNKIYTKKDFNSGDGMLTTVWGPSLWHTLHTISFNYPVNPTKRDKKNYKDFILSLKHILPCKYCRMNFKKNIKEVPLTQKALKNRHNFSKWMYCFHEHINKMLKKKSGLKYNDVRERYEHFRSRCTLDPNKTEIKKTRKNKKKRKNKTKKEKGCVAVVLLVEERWKLLSN